MPNISEGRDKNIIDQVTAEIEKVEGVKLLDVDPGMTTNRTVITFVGEPEPVCEAAYRSEESCRTNRYEPTPRSPPASGRYRCLSPHPCEQHYHGGGGWLCP